MKEKDDRELNRNFYRLLIFYAPMAHMVSAAASLLMYSRFDHFALKAAFAALLICGLFNLARSVREIWNYRLNPYCGVCGADAIECKADRKSLSPHPAPESGTESD